MRVLLVALSVCLCTLLALPVIQADHPEFVPTALLQSEARVRTSARVNEPLHQIADLVYQASCALNKVHVIQSQPIGGSLHLPHLHLGPVYVKPELRPPQPTVIATIYDPATGQILNSSGQPIGAPAAAGTVAGVTGGITGSVTRGIQTINGQTIYPGQVIPAPVEEPIHWIHDMPEEHDPFNDLTPQERVRAEQLQARAMWILAKIQSPLSETHDYGKVSNENILHAFAKLKVQAKALLDEYELRTGIKTASWKLAPVPQGMTEATGYILNTPVYRNEPEVDPPTPNGKIHLTVQPGENGLEAKLDLIKRAVNTTEIINKPIVQVGDSDFPSDLRITINPMDGHKVSINGNPAVGNPQWKPNVAPVYSVTSSNFRAKKLKAVISKGKKN